jgi:hypothetical protein
MSFIVPLTSRVCPVFAIGLNGKCGIGEQRLQGDRFAGWVEPLAKFIASDNADGAYAPPDGEAYNRIVMNRP